MFRLLKTAIIRPYTKESKRQYLQLLFIVRDLRVIAHNNNKTHRDIVVKIRYIKYIK